MYSFTDQYDFVVIDTNRASSSIKSGIIAADTVLIPTSGYLNTNCGVWDRLMERSGASLNICAIQKYDIPVT